MTETSVPTHEVKLYVGSCHHYNDQKFGQEVLIREIAVYQKSCSPDELISLRVTPTTYVVKDYVEEGWEVAVINYPRFPKSEAWTSTFMEGLAKHLLVALKQNRISVVTSHMTVMFESENAQENP